MILEERMENKKSFFQATLSSIIAGIVIGMIVYFGLNFSGFKEYRAVSSIAPGKGVEDISSLAATLDSKVIKERTLENLKIDSSLNKLDSRFKITSDEGKSLIYFEVVDRNKLRAEDLADEYADLSVIVINNLYNSDAKVDKYAYKNAKVTDNTLKYGICVGVAAFVLWIIVSFILVKRYNGKLKKKLTQNNVSEIREVSKEKKVLKEKENELPKEKEKIGQTQAIKKVDDDISHTRKIDRKEIEDLKEKAKNDKYQILGKLPCYEKGDLDV